jgi:peptidoglycan/LPS O-acetylase OafA/YrhL
MFSQSIALRLKQTDNHASGFDYLRVGLATSILIIHCWIVCGGFQMVNAMFLSPARPLIRWILPGFFALSGFLVAGSLERCRTLGMFLGLRILRIYPALAVEVVLSAFILGPLVTSFGLHQYFHNHLFYIYLRNVFGDVHFALPGVFSNNPLAATVNGQLWTIPFELGCYLTMAVLTVLGVRRWRVLAPLSVVTLCVAYAFVTLIHHHGVLVPVPGALNGALLIATFLSGVTIYLYKDIVPYSRAVCLGAVLATCLCLGIFKWGDFFAPFPAAYVTVYIGLCNPSTKLLRGADYSYGIFLYSFPVQQACYYYIPFARTPIGNFLVGLPATLLIAAFSWHSIEMPAQKLRVYLKRIENIYLSYRARPLRKVARDQLG